MAMTTPKKTVKHPNIDNKVILSFKKNIFKITVKGAAKENNILFLLGPIFCKATNSSIICVSVNVLVCFCSIINGMYCTHFVALHKYYKLIGY